MRRARFLFWLDLILLLAFALDQEPRPTGLPAHEWIGLGLTLLLALHLVVNWRWITNALTRLKSNTRRARVNFALNATLYVAMLLTLFSGIVISEFVLPGAGIATSTLRAWRQIHSLVAGLTLVIVGLHVAMNWEWIRNVALKLWARRGRLEVHGTRTLAQRLGIGDLGATTSRLVKLTVTTLALCAGFWLAVGRMATSRVPLRKLRAWQKPDLGEAPTEVGFQLLWIAGVAVAGRKVLRLKL